MVEESNVEGTGMMAGEYMSKYDQERREHMVNKTRWTGGEHTPFHATFGIASNGLMGLKPLPLLCSPVEAREKDDHSGVNRHTLSRRQRSGKKRIGGKGGKGRGVRGRVVTKASSTFSGRLLRTTKAAQAQRCVAIDD